jgi:hypothetical protein
MVGADSRTGDKPKMGISSCCRKAAQENQPPIPDHSRDHAHRVDEALLSRLARLQRSSRLPPWCGLQGGPGNAGKHVGGVNDVWLDINIGYALKRRPQPIVLGSQPLDLVGLIINDTAYIHPVFLPGIVGKNVGSVCHFGLTL